MGGAKFGETRYLKTLNNCLYFFHYKINCLIMQLFNYLNICMKSTHQIII